MKNKFSIIGYSGHSFVILDSAMKLKYTCSGYYDRNVKEINPFDIDYLGLEDNIVLEERVFISIGDNIIRGNVYNKLSANNAITFINIFDPTASISSRAFIKPNSSTSIGVNAVVNSLAQIDTGVIINTGAIIEHEVKIGRFSHIGPNATVCGDSTIGENVFIGAGSIILPNLDIGNNTLVQAGAVVSINVPADSTIFRNGKIKKNK